MSKTLQKDQWRSRVVGFIEKPANQFTANALNFRRHPNNQRDAFRGLVSELGFAGAVLENVTTGNLIDGHLRIEEALSVNENMLIPCVQVEMSEAEEKLLLASYDPINALATRDDEALSFLLSETDPTDLALQGFVEGLTAEVELAAGSQGVVRRVLKKNLIPLVKVVLLCPDLAIVESALAATGNKNRGEALKEICESYLSEKGQLDIQSEDSLAELLN